MAVHRWPSRLLAPRLVQAAPNRAALDTAPRTVFKTALLRAALKAALKWGKAALKGELTDDISLNTRPHNLSQTYKPFVNCDAIG